MKKIINLFVLILSSIFFLVGCSEIVSVSNDFISSLDSNQLAYSEDENETLENETYIEDDTADISSKTASEYSDISETNGEAEETEETAGSVTNGAAAESTNIESEPTNENITDEVTIEENGSFTDKDSVALYIYTYGKLPDNYITKKQAQDMGWNSKDNTMAEVLPGMSIGGDNFGNYEGLLPKKQGRTYKECDIDYEKGGRNAKRIVYSNDGLIFYTEDHYNSFEQLY